jgi:SIR2-like domain
MNVDLRDFPFDLIRSFDTRKGRGVIAFIGSGPSCHAGLPSWGGLIREIAYKLRFFDEVEADLKQNSFSQVADFLSGKVGEDNLKSKVVEIIKEKSKSSGSLHEKIVRLNFKGIVTTNYDLLITKADKQNYFSPPVTNRTSSLLRLLQGKNDPFIFHLHGSVLDPASIVLTLGSYNRIIAEKSVRNALSHLFASRDVLFIGFGFVDEHIQSFLTEFEKEGITNLNVFAVAPSSELSKVREYSLRKLNVTPIRLDDSNGDYGVSHLSQWLETLCNSVKQIEISKDNPSRIRLGKANLANRVYEIISNNSYHEVLISSLKTLPNRLDILHLCELGLGKDGKNELLDLLSPNEFRQVLMSANSYKSHIVLRDALGYLPPEPE